MPELLLELLSEEIPARMQPRAAEDLKRLVCDELKEAGLTFDSARSFATPRRLALVVDGLPENTPEKKEIRRGPRVGAPQSAIDGFLRSVGRPNVEHPDIGRQKTDKGEVYVFETLIASKPTARELPALLQGALDTMPWAKSMRWKPRQTQTWIRPIHSILAIFGGIRLELEYHLIHSVEAIENPTRDNTVFSGDTTQGHRFLAPEPITVEDFADYRDKLRQAYVVLDAAERARIIETEAARLAAGEGLEVRPDPALVAENAGLVEWPVVLMGRIEERFMGLPPEVLTTVLAHHQKYFALVDRTGAPAPRFIVVANTEAADGGAAIVAGNERVLRARLADAQFFWDQDRKRTLESRVADLDGVVFHDKLGSLGDKARRIEALAAEIAGYVDGADADQAKEAARLAKADLVTEMVGEFPELQGVMGRYYALAEGRPETVADAVAEHYAPAGPADRCPAAPVSIAVALADKIDTLVGFWAIGEKPTGSKDPYALRRAVLGVIRLIVENELRLSLLDAFYSALRAFDQILAKDLETLHNDVRDLIQFFIERLKVHLRDKGVRHDLISAVFAAKPDDDLVRLLKRVEVLRTFLATEDGEHLLTAYRRAANIVRIEEKRDKTSYDGKKVDPKLLQQAEEKAVREQLIAIERTAKKALEREDFAAAMEAMATLREPVDRFFDEVTVNCDDEKLRKNRLLLLGQIRATLDRVADFSKIEG